MNEVITKGEVEIGNLIYEIRGKQVMLDSDLAGLYECANGTKTINQAVKRHINRFPERFMFQLTEEESRNIWSQLGTKKRETRGGKYNKPFVFTERGVAMLATILRTEVAEEVSIKIMDAFVAMHKYISSNLIEQKYINNLVLEDHDKIKALETSFNKLEEKRKTNEIYFNGQIYDAYSKIQEIFKSATRKLIIVDAYADSTILDIIKYNKQYHNLKVIYDNTFHDRYFVIDNNVIYHCGASINRIGYKTFSITLVGDEEMCSLLINKIDKII